MGINQRPLPLIDNGPPVVDNQLALSFHTVKPLKDRKAVGPVDGFLPVIDAKDLKRDGQIIKLRFWRPEGEDHGKAPRQNLMICAHFTVHMHKRQPENLI